MADMMRIHHITLLTGEARRSHRGDVPGDELAACGDWIVRANHAAAPLALPAPHADHAGVAMRVQGGLGVTIYGPKPDIGKRAELLAFVVALQWPDAHRVWDVLMQNTDGEAEGLMRPPAPWCAVSLAPQAAIGSDARAWLARFEVACAWAWVTRNPVLRQIY